MLLPPYLAQQQYFNFLTLVLEDMLEDMLEFSVYHCYFFVISLITLKSNM